MGDANPICTLGDYSKPSHEGYRSTIKLPIGNNVVPLRPDTIRFVQNGCSFHGLLSTEDPKLQSLKVILKILSDFTLSFRTVKTGTAKLRNDILMFQQHQGESFSEVWTRFKDLLQKVPHHGIDLWLQVQIFYDHVNPVTRRTIDQSAGSKLRDRNAEEFWALLEDIALYDNESWNDPRDFAKPVKAISLPQDVLSTSDCHLRIELYDQVQCFDPYNLSSIVMEDPDQPLLNIEYVSSRTDEAREGLVSNFMASQDARFSKFEADFKQQQSEMTNKIDTVLKAITDRIAGALPSDTVKNPKLNINSTTSVLSAFSYPTTSQLQPGMGSGTQQPEEPKPTLEDEFQDLHLNLPVFEVLAHALIYNAILDKYMESLELGKNGLAFVQGKVFAKMEDPRLFTLPYPETPLLVGRGFLATSNAVIDCKMAKIAVGEGITRKDFLDCHLPEEWEIARDAEINPFKDVLVFKRMIKFLGAIPINQIN
ncbi:hypothetical protein Tco_0998535 [Tanacetum coccineum]